MINNHELHKAQIVERIERMETHQVKRIKTNNLEKTGYVQMWSSM